MKKKLKLSAETIRSLTTIDLARVVGGISVGSGCHTVLTCPFSGCTVTSQWCTKVATC